MFLTNFLSKCPIFTTFFFVALKKILVAHLQSGIIVFAKRAILNVWQCSEYVSILVTAQQIGQWPYAMYCSRHIQNNSTLCFFQVYATIFSVIKAYSPILRNSYGIFRLIQSYSAPCVTLTYSQPPHILSSGRFKTVWIFQILWNIDQIYSKPCHKALLSHIKAYPEPCATLGIVGILEYSEPFHNCITTHIQNSVMFTKMYKYSELWHIQNAVPRKV